MKSHISRYPISYKVIYEHMIVIMSGVLTNKVCLDQVHFLGYSYVIVCDVDIIINFNRTYTKVKIIMPMVYRFVFIEQYVPPKPCHRLLFQQRGLLETVCSVS